MNAIQITMYSEGGLRLPLAYQSLLQGLVYAAWREQLPELHDRGWRDEGKVLRLFTFSRLEGTYRIQGKEILFTGPVSFELRSAVERSVEAFCGWISGRSTVRLGEQLLTVEKLACRDQLLFPGKAVVRARSPVTVHKTLADGHTRYFSPDEEAWGFLLAENLASKLAVLGSDCAPMLSAAALPGRVQKQVTRFKGTYITGYTGLFEIEAPPEAMGILYYSGLGSRGSQGFGLFDLIG